MDNADFHERSKYASLTSKNLITSSLRQLASIDPSNDINETVQQNLQNATLPSQSVADNAIAKLSRPSATNARSALLTLHFFFPFDFLPALDLIDRHLIQRLICHDPEHPEVRLQTFYVQSASAVTSSAGVPSNDRSGRSRGGGRFGNRNYAATRVHYEVRLDSWNCSCPAFAAASLKLILGVSEGETEQAELYGPGLAARIGLAKPTKENVQGYQAELSTSIGGVATKDDAIVPVCKHILAAALCDAAPLLFGSGMQVKEVGVNESAAWAAGWGEA